MTSRENVGCQLQRGEGHIVLVAPHAARRPPIDPSHPPRRLRVNDLYTAEVASLLAAPLRATTLVNRGVDRNRIDLNRFSEVCLRAPWFGELLVETLADVMRRHGRAQVLFLHGWHTGQARCDVGIGAAEVDGHLRVPAGAGLTVPQADVQACLRRLRQAFGESSIHVSVGERYPASHHNNLLQVFSERGLRRSASWARTIARWAADGQVAAMQLELGAPLRWPGPWRERFLAAMRKAFVENGSPENRRAPSAHARKPVDTGRSRNGGQGIRPPGVDLQFYDGRAGVGGVVGLGSVGAERVGGRLLLFLGGKSVALFTGETRNPVGTRVPPLTLSVAPPGLHCSFKGPVLCLDDASRYLDLEAALAGSNVAEAELEVAFTPTTMAQAGAGPQFGRIEGTLRIGGRAERVRARGFVGARSLSSIAAGGLTLAADLEGEGVVARADNGNGAASGMRLLAARNVPMQDVQLSAVPDAQGNPGRIELRQSGSLWLEAIPLTRMSILRPAARDHYLRVNFGVAECRSAEGTGHAFYEHGTLVAARQRTPG